MDHRALLLEVTDIIGARFGTDNLSVILHTLIRMQAPEVIVELGTGLGLSALWMGLAARLNQRGHVWTVDNFEYFETHRDKVREIVDVLRAKSIVSLDVDTPGAEHFYTSLSTRFGLDPYLTFVKGTISLAEKGHFDRYPFGQRAIDLLFSDFKHDGITILALLGHFLPRMSDSSSIFIHSASTSWSSFLLLEQICTQLNAGRIPKALQKFCADDLGNIMRNRRVVLVHLTEPKDSRQNSAAWLKIEPVDVFPQPFASMRR